MSKDNKYTCKNVYDVKTGTLCLDVTWTFLKFSEVAIYREFYISPFSPDPECQLELFFSKREQHLNLKAANILKENLNSDVFVAIIDENGKELYAARETDFVLEASRKFNDIIGYTHQTLSRKLDVCPNDTVILEIKFRIKNTKPWYWVLYDCKSEITLTEDLKKFILEMLPKEVVLITKDDRISVNKAILCARSPVFKKMFYHPTSEQENSTVVIDDLMGSTIRNLVDFLDSGEVDLKIEFRYLKELYYAADKYEVMDLRNLCAANIIAMMTIENVREALVLAKEHSDEHLEKGCMIFIGRNMDTIMETKYWEDLKSSEPNLGSKICELYAKGVSMICSANN